MTPNGTRNPSKPNRRQATATRDAPVSLLNLLVISLVSLFLAWRLISFTLKNAVNILFGDQWDLYGAFFTPHSLWQIFDWQHGPVRQGLGLICEGMLAALTHWNMRAEAVAFAATLCCAAALAVWLKYRLFGSLQFTDITIPFLLLTRAQFETMLGASSLSFGVFPLLFTVLFCLAWLHSKRMIRYALVLFLNFLVMFMAYGFFMGLITPPLLAFDCYRAWRTNEKSALGVSIAALVLSLLSLSLFFVGLMFEPAVACFRFPYGNGLAYPEFVGMMFANIFGLKGHGIRASAVGIALFVCVAVAVLHNVARLWRNQERTKDASRVVVILSGYGLLYCLNASIGRVCQGVDFADSSRYITYAVSAMLGLYFYFLTLEKKKLKNWGLFILLLGSVAAGVRLGHRDISTAAWLTNGKRAWKNCYLQTENIERCNESTGFMIYPVPEPIEAKLAYLKQNRLNLYSDEK